MPNLGEHDKKIGNHHLESHWFHSMCGGFCLIKFQIGSPCLLNHEVMYLGNKPFHLDMCSSAIQPQPRTLRRAPKPSVDVVATCFASVAAPDIRELFKPLWGYTLPESNVAPENRPSQLKLVFQPSIFRGDLSVSGRVTPISKWL